jgi:hypothetical protein
MALITIMNPPTLNTFYIVNKIIQDKYGSYLIIILCHTKQIETMHVVN